MEICHTKKNIYRYFKKVDQTLMLFHFLFLFHYILWNKFEITDQGILNMFHSQVGDLELEFSETLL